jgi:hypothetical protein
MPRNTPLMLKKAKSGENLAGVRASPQDLVKPSTCFLGRSLMTQADLNAMVSEGCFVSGI